MAVSRITAAIINDLNRVAINATPSLINNNGLESAINRPAWTLRYNPTTPVQRLAAELAFGIIMNHPFADGNKRTAFLAANEYLRYAGARPFVNADPQYVIAHMSAIGGAHSQVAQQAMTVEQLANVYATVLGACSNDGSARLL